MKGHVGAVLTSGLSAIALALALFQVMVLANSHPRPMTAQAVAPSGSTNRYSMPGGRSGIPWDNPDHRSLPATPGSREGRSPGVKPPEEHRAPPPSRQRGLVPSGPRPARRAAA